MTDYNPYNFAPLETAPVREEWDKVRKHHFHAPDTFSGRLLLEIIAITPIFIPSRLPEDVVEKPDKKGVMRIDTFKKFHHNGQKPTIPATSLKGMVRAAFEARTNSCMALIAEEYKDKRGHRQKYPADSHCNSECNKANGLCPACAVFGTLQEDKCFQGKIRLADAELGEKSPRGLENNHNRGWVLKILSSPKPERHVSFYAKNGNSDRSGPRGRKFYFHHDPQRVDIEHPTRQHTSQNVKILERLGIGAILSSCLDFAGLTEPQLAYLLYAIELEESLGHKIGFAKPLGLGSIRIRVSKGAVCQGAARYRSFAPLALADIRAEIDQWRTLVTPLAADSIFRDLLLLDKQGAQDAIKYPEYRRDRAFPRILGTKGEIKYD